MPDDTTTPPPTTVSRGPQRAVVGGVSALAIFIAAAFIMPREGDNNRVGYFDRIAHLASYCYGGTGPRAIVGHHYTAQECHDQLADDVRTHAAGISRCLTRPLPDKTFAALISLSYNAGIAGVCHSTVVRRFNAGDIRGGCDAFRSWVYSRGVRIQGLANRREAERTLCLQGLQP